MFLFSTLASNAATCRKNVNVTPDATRSCKKLAGCHVMHSRKRVDLLSQSFRRRRCRKSVLLVQHPKVVAHTASKYQEAPQRARCQCESQTVNEKRCDESLDYGVIRSWLGLMSVLKADCRPKIVTASNCRHCLQHPSGSLEQREPPFYLPRPINNRARKSFKGCLGQIRHRSLEFLTESCWTTLCAIIQPSKPLNLNN